MLRKNSAFLSFIEGLYFNQQRQEDIILKTYSKDSLLLKQGERATKVNIIKEGIIKCFFNEENDKHYILEFMGEGEILGEIEVIKKIPCLNNVKALTVVNAYVISIPYFRSLLEKNLELNTLLLEELAERIINTSSRASYQQLYTIEHTLTKLMELQSQQQITISKDDMAAYLGVTRRSLNRALKNLPLS